MTKADWLKLAMPASITLLALAVFSAPLVGNAQLEWGDRIKVEQHGTWRMRCD
ncbi:hypothetical protein [Synechococcus sp. CC9605]|uniref:hypothetical protein n=1 Tax=Synechococcus sp. (strain CC9605) TaxID=110662 RepID=UPI0012EACCE1|nr:hypothetical protein [Synechococcus sp. CC9605]